MPKSYNSPLSFRLSVISPSAQDSPIQKAVKGKMMRDNPLLRGTCSSMAYLLVLSPVILISTGLNAASAELEMKLSKWESYVERNSPPALPARRKRRLSLPLAKPVKVGFPGLRTVQKSHSQ